MRRLRVAVLLTFAGTFTFLLTHPPAVATTGCTFAAPVATVTIDTSQSVTIKRSGSAIQVNGANCGAATVSNTATVVVNGSTGHETATLDLGGGPFQPGAGAEQTGLAEIEFEVNLGSGSSPPDMIAIQGTGAADTYRLGRTGINLDNDDDADVTGPAAGLLATTSAELFDVSSGAGPDAISAAGAVGGTTDPMGYGVQTQLDGGTQNDAITGGNSEDAITGGAGADTEVGGEGNDRFLEGAAADGNDDVSGGGGPYDVVDYGARTAVVDVSLDEVANDGQPGVELDNVRNDIEEFALGSANDTFIDTSGQYQSRTIYGGSGADSITGGAGSDTIYGCGPSNDPEYGGSACDADGGDTLHGGPQGDDFYGQNGADQEVGEAGHDRFHEGVPASPNGADDISGGLDEDLVDYSQRTAPLTATMNDNAANDGQAGEGDNVRSDVEDLNGSHGGSNKITGTSLDNVLAGGIQKDTIVGLAGNDTMNGSDGDDALLGGTGNDRLYGGYGNDSVQGQGDDDTLGGDPGDDSLIGGPGIDNESGASGDDTFYEDRAPNGSDTLNGDFGTDTASYAKRAAPLSVTLDDVANDGDSGSSENDNVKSSVENIVGGSGNDTLTGSQYDNTIDGGLGADVIEGGSSGTDTATYATRSSPVVLSIDGVPADGADTNNDGHGDEGDNVMESIDNLVGGTGNDILTGSLKANVFAGGAGVDTVSYANRSGDVMVDLDGVADDGSADASWNSIEKDNVGVDVENVIGGSGNDRLTGNAANNRLDGRLGADILTGMDGDDVEIAGDRGKLITLIDTFDEGSAPNGNDAFFGPGGEVDYHARTDDVRVSINNVADDGDAAAGELDNAHVGVGGIETGWGNDVVVGGAEGIGIETHEGDDLILGGPGPDSIDGGPGFDTVSYASRTIPVYVNLDDVNNDGQDANLDGVSDEHDNVGTTVEQVVGGNAADVLVGDDGANTLVGGNGEDYLDGKAGSDKLHGQDADDTLTDGPGNDEDFGEAGDDWFVQGGPAAQGADKIFGGPGLHDRVWYSERTGATAVWLDGSSKSGDTGSHEGDTVQIDVEEAFGGSGQDTLHGNDFPNLLNGGKGPDDLHGSGGEDSLQGSSGNDFLEGEGAADTLLGGSGSDQEFGGPGNDTSTRGRSRAARTRSSRRHRPATSTSSATRAVAARSSSRSTGMRTTGPTPTQTVSRTRATM